MNRYILLLFFLVCHFQLLSQGIKGIVQDSDGKPLPFATIYIEELATGTSTNSDAYYELPVIEPGIYTVYYKFIGFETRTKKVEISSDYERLDIKLKPQTIILNEVVARSNKTDPANWMMRKAIAKSSYYRQLIDSYSAKVYVKGKGQLLNIPFYLRGALKKEGIDTSTIILTESISKVKFTRPNQFSEEVISVYASKKTDFSGSPMPYITSSFYEDEVINAISPLSKKAFQYYRFKHIGAFKDGGNLVNKIKVTPKVKGPNVFEGEIHLVEEDWAIYFLDLRAQIDYGANIHVNQMYQLIDEAAWMPITHQLGVSGKLMGVEFKFDYMASVSDYSIQLNPAIPRDIVIKDEESDEKIDAAPIVNDVNDLKKLKGEKVAIEIKELPKIMDKYEKVQSDSLSKLDIIAVYDFKSDSAAYSQDSLFWNKIRPIPLSEKETRGYKKLDSLSLIKEAEEIADSIKNYRKGTFQIFDLITGGTYELDSAGKNKFLIYNAILNTQYNTVDGINFTYSLGYKRKLSFDHSDLNKTKQDITYYRDPYLLIKPTLRYNFARSKLNSQILGKFQFPTGSLNISGGNYVSQFNGDEPIGPLVNTGFTLLWEQNLMKTYEKDFVSVSLDKKLSSKWDLSVSMDLEKRYQLLNNSFFSLFDWDRSFTPNLPSNNEFYTSFDQQKAFVAKVVANYKPFIKYEIRNGLKRPVETRFSEFTFEYSKGIPNLFNSDVDFDRIEISYKDKFKIGAKGTTFLNFKLGSFLNNEALGFMDYAHFPGNISFVTLADPVASYRLLDYYFYSTKRNYIQLFTYHEFRKLALTQITPVRFMGIKEAAFINYLKTPSSNNYTEIGYSVGGILKFFRLELVSNFENFQYKSWGLRVGIQATLGD